MTMVTFYSKGSRLTGFQISGHSGYAEQGADIVCAAITSAVRLTECAVNDVLGLGAAVRVEESDAFLSLKLPGSVGEVNESICQTLLASLMLYLHQLHEEFPEHVIVYDLDDTDEQSK